MSYVKRRNRAAPPVPFKGPDQDPDQPVIYCAQMVQEQAPVMQWISWTGPQLKLVLSPLKTVQLREGDQILSFVQRDGQLDVYGYRPRTEH